MPRPDAGEADSARASEPAPAAGDVPTLHAVPTGDAPLAADHGHGTRTSAPAQIAAAVTSVTGHAETPERTDEHARTPHLHVSDGVRAPFATAAAGATRPPSWIPQDRTSRGPATAPDPTAGAPDPERPTVLPEQPVPTGGPAGGGSGSGAAGGGSSSLFMVVLCIAFAPFAQEVRRLLRRASSLRSTALDLVVERPG